MKRQAHLIPILVCALTLVSCSNPAPTAFRAYWNKEASPVVSNLTEKADYVVSYVQANGENLGYTLNYSGTFSTELKVQDGNYVYSTDLSATVTYTVGDTHQSFTDSVVSTVTFKGVNDALFPVSSFVEATAHTPVYATDASTVNECYRFYSYELETTYENKKGTAIYTAFDEEGGELTSKTNSFSTSGDYSYVDNAELVFALRGLPSASKSLSLSVFNFATTSLQTVGIQKDTVASEKFSFDNNGDVLTEKLIKYTPYTYSVSSGKTESNQSVWIAQNGASLTEQYFNVILKRTTPLPYNLGEIVYTLTAFERAE